MEYKLKELSSVQVIIRGTKQDDKYVFAVVSNDALKIIKEKKGPECFTIYADVSIYYDRRRVY